MRPKALLLSLTSVGTQFLSLNGPDQIVLVNAFFGCVWSEYLPFSEVCIKSGQWVSWRSDTYLICTASRPPEMR